MQRALLSLLLLSACTTSPGTRPRAAPDPVEPRGPAYSPWVVSIGDPMASFDVISFKDVGLSSVPDEARPHVYAGVARSLASELDGQLQSEASYSASAADPSSHLACESRHLYVDLWESASPHRLGYSLWSGCGEDDQFAWEELPHAEPAGASGAIVALAEHIAGSIHEAMRTGCFTRAC